jgi:hypothetical protein
MRFRGPRSGTTHGLPQCATVWEERHQVSKFKRAELSTGRGQADAVGGLERRSQCALVVMEGVRERQEFGLSAPNSSKT